MNFEGIEKQGAFSGSMSHVPPPSRYWKKRGKHPRLYALFKHPYMYNAQILKFSLQDVVNPL